MNVVSPSQWENIPAEMLSSVLIPAAIDSPCLNTPNRAELNVLIPRDNKDYQNDFNFVENGLYNDRSLASSVVRMVSKDPNDPVQVYLGNEMPVKLPEQRVESARASWVSRLSSEIPFPEAMPEEPKEPDLDREQYPRSFMIVPPVNALVEFTKSLQLEEVKTQLVNSASESETISTGSIKDRQYTSVSDPIKITKNHQLRFWRKNQAPSPYIAYRGFSGYVRRMFKNHPRKARKQAIKQWAQTRHRIFWEHHSRASTSKDLFTS